MRSNRSRCELIWSVEEICKIPWAPPGQLGIGLLIRDTCSNMSGTWQRWGTIRRPKTVRRSLGLLRSHLGARGGCDGGPHRCSEPRVLLLQYSEKGGSSVGVPPAGLIQRRWSRFQVESYLDGGRLGRRLGTVKSRTDRRVGSDRSTSSTTSAARWTWWSNYRLTLSVGSAAVRTGQLIPSPEIFTVGTNPIPAGAGTAVLAQHIQPERFAEVDVMDEVTDFLAILRPGSCDDRCDRLPAERFPVAALITRRKRRMLWGLGVLLLLSIALSLFIGRYPSPYWMPPQLLVEDTLAQRLVVNLRMPRILVAMLLGMSLAGAGTVMQMIFHNPLVEPGFLGVSQGASFGAALGIVA